MPLLRYLKLIILLWGGYCGIFAQQPQLALRQYTTDDGLPSQEVYEVIQDRYGYLWFGTDNGLSRFNGYEFRNYSTLDGLTDGVVFYLQEDLDGRIWMATLSGQMFYYEHESDRIYPFWGNDVIREAMDQFDLVQGMYVDSSQHIHLSLRGYGVLQFKPDSTWQLFQFERGEQGLYGVEQKILMNVSQYGLKSKHAIHKGGKVRFLKLPITLKSKGIQSEGFLLSKDTILLVGNYYMHIVPQSGETYSRPFDKHVAAFYQNARQEIFLGLNHGGGLYKYDNLDALRRGQYQNILPGYSVTHILEDREGGYWFTTLEDGVFYCPDPNFQIYDQRSGLADNFVYAVYPKNAQEWFIGLWKGVVYHLNTETKTLQDLQSPSAYCFDLLYEEENDVLWNAGSRIYRFSKNTWKDFFIKTGKNRNSYQCKRLWQSPQSRNIWGSAGTRGFFKINGGELEPGFHSMPDVSALRTPKVIETSDGRVWAGTVSGLFEFKNNKLIAPNVEHPAFTERMEDLAELPDGTLAIATKGRGIILWRGDKFRAITAADGLTSNVLENLHLDAAGRLWAGTLMGLNRITFSQDTFQIRQYTRAHGLPSNEINKVATLGDKVWVATTKGLAVFEDRKTLNANSPSPVIEGFYANENRAETHESLLFKHYENNIGIRFTSLQFRNAGRLRYRYRLEANQPWIITKEYRLNFVALQPDAYQFEVQAQNEDGVWSASTMLPFEIRPAWWQTSWFFIGIGLAMIGGIYFFYRQRLSALQRESEIQAKMVELERKALSAQMNPHFVFNCLNSMQLLIQNNQGKTALQYLSRFARLIRSLLDFSRYGKVSITEEVRALEDYLELEKLRFKERLRYRIMVADDIDPFDTEIPPMLIQPFVENALKHGFFDEKSRFEVQIIFEKEGDFLKVSVKDNGKGFDTTHISNGRSRYAYGIQNTRQRLEFINKSNHAAPLHIHSDPEGGGTDIQMRIRLS